MIAAARRRIGAACRGWRQADRAGRAAASTAAANRALRAGLAGAGRGGCGRGAPRKRRGAWAGADGCARSACSSPRARAWSSAGCGAPRRWRSRGATRASAVAHPAAGDRRGDRRRRRLPGRLPVRRLPRGRDRPARLRRACRRGARRRRSTSRTAGDAHSYLLVPLGAARRRCSGPGAAAASGAASAGVVFALGLLAVAVDPARRPARRPRRRRPDHRASPAPPRCSRTASTPSSRQRRALVLAPDCSTMRGRAEYESTCQEGPQAPEEEDDDAGPQVGAGSQEGA